MYLGFDFGPIVIQPLMYKLSANQDACLIITRFLVIVSGRVTVMLTKNGRVTVKVSSDVSSIE